MQLFPEQPPTAMLGEMFGGSAQTRAASGECQHNQPQQSFYKRTQCRSQASNGLASLAASWSPPAKEKEANAHWRQAEAAGKYTGLWRVEPNPKPTQMQQAHKTLKLLQIVKPTLKGARYRYHP